MLAAEAQAAAAATPVGEEAAAADASMMRRSGSSSGLAGEAVAEDPEPQPMGEAELRVRALSVVIGVVGCWRRAYVAIHPLYTHTHS